MLFRELKNVRKCWVLSNRMGKMILQPVKECVKVFLSNWQMIFKS